MISEQCQVSGLDSDLSLMAILWPVITTTTPERSFAQTGLFTRLVAPYRWVAAQLGSVQLPARWLARHGWGVQMSSQLLARITQGEHAAFKQCLEQYGGMIWRLARRLSPTPSDAEDATQDVFLQLWKNAKHFDAQRGSEAIFIVTLARRTLISRFRSRQRRPHEVSVEELPDSNWQATHDTGEPHAEARLAAQALATLPIEQQRVLKLAIVQGLSQSEIAAHTGLPLGTVKTLMRRGLIAVRDKLGVSAGQGARS